MYGSRWWYAVGIYKSDHPGESRLRELAAVFGGTNASPSLKFFSLASVQEVRGRRKRGDRKVRIMSRSVNTQGVRIRKGKRANQGRC